MPCSIAVRMPTASGPRRRMTADGARCWRIAGSPSSISRRPASSRWSTRSPGTSSRSTARSTIIATCGGGWRARDSSSSPAATPPSCCARSACMDRKRSAGCAACLPSQAGIRSSAACCWRAIISASSRSMWRVRPTRTKAGRWPLPPSCARCSPPACSARRSSIRRPPRAAPGTASSSVQALPSKALNCFGRVSSSSSMAQARRLRNEDFWRIPGRAPAPEHGLRTIWPPFSRRG